MMNKNEITEFCCWLEEVGEKASKVGISLQVTRRQIQILETEDYEQEV